MKYLIIPFFMAALLASAQPAKPQSNPLPMVPPEALGMGPARSTSRSVRSNEAAAAIPTPPPRVVYEGLITTDAPITIAPNNYTILQAQSDFTHADHAAIAITSLGQDLTGLRVLPAWAAPGTYFNVTDINGPFAALDHGGMYTPVYGPFLKVMLFNTGSTPLQVKQLTVYALTSHQ
jgi:hypothetical protein